MMIIAFVWSLMSENGENRSLTHEYQSRYDLKSTDIDPPGIPGHVSFFLRCRTWTAQRILQAQIFRTAFSVMTSRTFSQSSLTQALQAAERQDRMTHRSPRVTISRHSTTSSPSLRAADQGLDGKDIGIDLVCTLNDGSFAAVQCKFYRRNASVPKGDIDSFISASEKRFSHRFLVATNERWTDNCLNTLRNASPSVSLITLKEFESSDIDWKSLLAGKKRIIRKKLLRPYQKEALDRVVSGFKTGDRGKLLMACGTGKTFTSLRIAERMVDNAGGKGLVLFLVPSIALVSQTVSEWAHQASLKLVPYAVCSDRKVGQTKNEGDEDFMGTSELPYPPTTDPHRRCPSGTGAIRPS